MQTTIEKKANEQKQIIAIVLFVLAIAFGFFFTKEQYYSYLEKADTLETISKNAGEKKESLDRLVSLGKEIAENASLQSDIERYAGVFREDTILDSLFAPMDGVNISSVSIAHGEKMPNGLSLANLNLTFQAQDLTTLKGFLNYLTASKTNKKSYMIKSLSFPFDLSKNEPITSNVTLGMYYFE